MSRNIILTTDSGMVPNKKYNPIIIPDQITDNKGNAYKDNNKEIKTKEIINNKNIKYKTAAPLIEDYLNIFIPLLEKNNDIIHLSLGSGLSTASINNSNLIAQNLNQKYKNKIYIIDSLTGSIGGTCYYEKAFNELINSNLPTKELVKKLEEIKYQIKTSFYVPDPTGFINSGRDNTNKHSISKEALTLSSKLLKIASIKYRVDFHESGELYLNKIFRSNKKNGMLNMTKEIINKNTINNYENDFYIIENLLKKDIEINDIYKYIESLKYFKKILINEIGNVVAPYGCNDLCGISLIKKKKD